MAGAAAPAAIRGRREHSVQSCSARESSLATQFSSAAVPAIDLIAELFAFERDLPSWQVIDDGPLPAAALSRIREMRT
jgi:hypothetical protein